MSKGTCEACRKLRRTDTILPFGEIGACFVCRIEWIKNRRVWSLRLGRYMWQARREVMRAAPIEPTPWG